MNRSDPQNMLALREALNETRGTMARQRLLKQMWQLETVRREAKQAVNTDPPTHSRSRAA